MDDFYSYIDYYRALLGSFPFVIQVAIVTIFVNFLVTIIFFLSAFFIRRKKAKKDLIIKQQYPDTISFIKDILTSDNVYSDTEILDSFMQKFKKLKEKNYIPVLLALEDLVHEDSSLLESKNYFNLIKGLKIDVHLEKKLDFSDTQSRLKAFQSLSRLNLTVSDSKILPHTYSKNNSLRKESRSSYIAISKNDPFKFFDRENYNLNYWDQISLLQQLELHHKDNLPNFSKWIKYSNDKSQIVFLIRAVAYFNQTHSSEIIKELIETTDHDIRKEAILALGKMKVEDTEEAIKKIYYNQPVECQNAIIQTVTLIQSGKSLDFLINAYHEASNLDTKKLVAEAIYLYGTEGQRYFENLYKTEKGFNSLILQHVKNPLVPSPLKDYFSRKKENQPNFSYA